MNQTLICYVDDLLLTSVEHRIQECKKMLVTKFEMKDLGLMHYYFVLEVWKKIGEIYLSQGKDIIKILQNLV